jgi:hypothetical protein
MRAPLLPPHAARSLGTIGLALSGLLLMGFHQVVNGALQHAQAQRAQASQLAQVESACRSLADAPQRALCMLRLESSQSQTLTAAN